MYLSLFPIKKSTDKDPRNKCDMVAVVDGPFEGEEEGTRIASDVVRVEDEDPGSPGYLGHRGEEGCMRFPIAIGASSLARSR